MRVAKILPIGGLCVLLLAAGAKPLFGQALTTGSIAGVVKDKSGAVIPGVKVEVSSPALIEKVRDTVTGSGGEYKIVTLPIGTYTVTFSLQGFQILQREGIQLTADFTALVDAELSIGSMTQTVEVTTASPVVDVQNVGSQSVLTKDQLDSLPTTQSLVDLSQITLAMVPSASGSTGLDADVGGNKGEQIADVAVHGGTAADQISMINGLSMQHTLFTGSGFYRLEFYDPEATQELNIIADAGNAEVQSAGVQVNMVTKSGSNDWHFHFATNGTDSRFENTNLDANLIARGVKTPPGVKDIYSIGGSAGGAIIKDKLWMFVAVSRWGATENVASNYYNATQGTFVYTPDLTRPATRPSPNKSLSGNFTWQATKKDQFSFFPMLQDNCNCRRGVDNSPPTAPEGVEMGYFDPLVNLGSTWSHIVSDKIVLAAGVLWVDTHAHYAPAPEVKFGDAPITNSSTGVLYNSRVDTLLDRFHDPEANGYVSATFLEGPHAIKVGYTFLRGYLDQSSDATDNPPIAYTISQATPTSPVVPVSITEYAIPGHQHDEVANMGLYGQDQWTIKRLTLNLGVRYDYLHAWVPAGSRPDGVFSPGFSFAEVNNVPDWKDINPRLGAAYDIFGNGKTAVKFSWGRYDEAESLTIAAAANPENAISTSGTRTWNDPNFNPTVLTANYTPPCSLLSPLAQGTPTDGCGAVSPSTFGGHILTTQYSPEVLTGWNVRPAIYKTSALLQQQLFPGVGLTVGYYRTSYTNQEATKNTAVPATAYSPYSVTMPVDPRLPGGGGYIVTGFYDENPAYFGQSSNVIFRASDFGDPSQVFNGFDISINARLKKGIVVTGGASDGQTVTSTCYIVNSPQDLRDCKVTLPWRGQLQFKGQVVYPLPWWHIRASAVFQNLAGDPVLANYTVSNAVIAPSLGRNLTACGNQTEAASACHATATLNNVVTPDTLFENRLQQLDLELSKIIEFREGKSNLTLNFGAYNLFNANTILIRNNTYGSAWGTPSDVLAPRLFKFGMAFSY